MANRVGQDNASAKSESESSILAIGYQRNFDSYLTMSIGPAPPASRLGFRGPTELRVAQEATTRTWAVDSHGLWLQLRFVLTKMPTRVF